MRDGEPLAEPLVDRGQSLAFSAWSASRAGSVSGVSQEESANGDRTAELPLFTPRRVIQTVVVVLALLVGIYFLFPKLVGLSDALSKLGDADPVWIAIAIGFNVVAFATYIALFKAVVGGEALRLTWVETYEINMAGLAATLLFSAAGAGGIVLTYWALRKAGMRRRDVARRMVAFLTLHYAFYPIALIVFGVLLRTGVLHGRALGRADDRPGGGGGAAACGRGADRADPARPGAAGGAVRARGAGQGDRPQHRPGAGDGRGGVPVRARALRPPLARRAGGDRRRRLLGGQHRHPLGLLPRLRRPRAARRRRPGLLPRHGRQPLPAARRPAWAPSTPA